MIASTNAYGSSETTLFSDLLPVNIQRPPRDVPTPAPQWPTEEAEFQALERAHQREAALWSQLGNWDM